MQFSCLKRNEEREGSGAVMTIPFLCLVCFFFVCWVLILKGEVSSLKQDNERMKKLLEKKLGHLSKQVEVTNKVNLKGEQASRDMLAPPG